MQIGSKHGRLTILAFIPGGKHPKVQVRCECGTEKLIQRDNLARTHSCGCLKRELTGQKNLQHGRSGSREFKAWADMLQRCRNPNRRDYARYGGVGVTVCQRWIDSFTDFYADMGPQPTPKHSIDRINNALGYTPENCRWATTKEQRLNQRRQTLHTFEGITATLKDHAARLGLSYTMVVQRVRTLGWSVEKALTHREHH